MLRIKTKFNGIMCFNRSSEATEKQIVYLFDSAKQDGNNKNKRLKFNHKEGIFNHPLSDITSVEYIGDASIDHLFGWVNNSM